MESSFSLALTGLALALTFTTVIWVGSVFRRDASTVDVFWGLGFVMLAWFYWSQVPHESFRQLLVPILVTIWGGRLALHILKRNKGQGEDYRYAAMREKWGGKFPWVSLVTVFWLQGVLFWIIAMPLLQLQVSRRPPGWTWLDTVGVGLFVVGFVFESVGDLQLTRFKADPGNEGQVMDRGLWRYTRHPNYFGDVTLWWGFGSFALATEGSSWTLISPLLMTFLLVKVSGIALLEKGLAKSKPGYAEYVRRTSTFFPWPPRG